MAHIRSRKHAAAAQPRLHCTAALAAALALPGALQAQTAPATPAAGTKAEATLPEVKVKGSAENAYKADTVSSPKFTQPLVDTPQTITVIKKEILQQQGAVTLSEALANTPGITFLMGENGNTATGDSIFMRGFDTQGSIFVDGIRDLGTISRDVFNIEQVEVVKGPAGTDNGRGAPTGYVNLSSKQPQAEDFSAGTLAVGSGAFKRATVDLNRKLGADSNTAVRLNLMAQDSNAIDRDRIERQRWGIAPSIAFGLGTPTRVTLSYLHVDQDNRPDGGFPSVGLWGYKRATQNGITVDLAPVDRSNYYGSLSDSDEIQADMFTARVEHDLAPGVTVRNISRYGRTQQNYVLTGVNSLTFTRDPDGTAGPLPFVAMDPADWTVSRSRQGKDQRNEILANQTNLTAEFKTGGIKHSLSTGLEFIYEKQTSLGMAASGSQGAANLYHPSVGDAFVPVVHSGASTKGSTTTVGVYAFDTLDLSDRLKLTLGLRFDKYRTEFDGISLSTATSHPSLPVGTLVPTSLSVSDSLLTGKAGLVFKPAENGSVYVAYATSQKPPGSDNFTLAAPPSGTATTSNINNPNLDPQKATSIELGTKWDVLDNKLALTAAVFRTENKNDLADRDPVTGAITQYGKKRVQGIELGAVGQITPAWQLSAGLASMDTKVIRGTATQTGAGLNWSPKLTFTAWTTYRLPFGLTLGGGARYVDSQVRSIAATLPTTNLASVPSYWVFDAMAGYEVNKNVSVQLNVYNLADKFYVASLNNGGSRATLGAPRSVQLSANFKF